MRHGYETCARGWCTLDDDGAAPMCFVPVETIAPSRGPQRHRSAERSSPVRLRDFALAASARLAELITYDEWIGSGEPPPRPELSRQGKLCP